MMTRSIKTVLLACLIAFAGFVHAQQDGELKFGFTPVLSQAEMRAEFEP